MEHVRPGDPKLARRLAAAVEGEVKFDPFTRGRYSTDASIYQIEPIGVVIPRTAADVAAAIEIAREEGVPVLPRGAGTSQCGQAVGRALVVDVSKHLRRIKSLDLDNPISDLSINNLALLFGRECHLLFLILEIW